jgi:dienelactone hydrolase
MPHRYERPWAFSDGAIRHEIYSTGLGPDVIVMHELPGLTKECLDLGVLLSKELPARVHLPLLFGNPQPGFLGKTANALGICISREIHAFAANKKSPIVCWCRALCRELRSKSNTPGVGVVGMCLTGGFALTLVADDSVLASVVAQPSLPLFVHKAALGISDEDSKAARAHIDRLGTKCVFGLRYQRDFISSAARMDAVRRLVGPGFECLELPGNGHSTLTAANRDPRALARTISFLRERLNIR